MLSWEIISTIDPLNRYKSLISRCIKSKDLHLGRALHADLIKKALTLNIFISNRLIEMYSKCDSVICSQEVFDQLPVKNTHSWNTIIFAYCRAGWFDKAQQLFDEMPEPNLVTYNSFISSLNHHGYYTESVNAFKRMQKQYGIAVMDEFTFVSLVGACGSLCALQLLRQIHGLAITHGLKFSLVTDNALIYAYGKCGKPDISHFIFNLMCERDVVSWTSMVVAYARASRLTEARSIFDRMPAKNTVSWTALITGHAQNGEGIEALNLYEKMQEEGVPPNAFTHVSVLSACANLAAIARGKQMHGHILKSGNIFYPCDLYLVNALIDMYCKCGDMRSAITLFEEIPRKDSVTWNSVITGMAQNGHGEESLQIFKRMREANLKPNHVTFLGVLSACSHTGLVAEALHILGLMQKDFGVIPTLEHYAILIDLLARNNREEEAMKLIEKAPPNGSDHVGMWGALLGSCRVHGNLELGGRAAKALFKLEPENSGRYILLANVYAAAGRWVDSNRVRKLMNERALRKHAAYSWIEVRNTRHQFIAKDKSHSDIEEIYELLLKLVNQMTDIGYVPLVESSCFTQDGEVP